VFSDRARASLVSSRPVRMVSFSVFVDAPIRLMTFLTPIS